MTSWGKGQSTSSDSQQTVRRPTTLVSDWLMSVWALTLAQGNQLLTRCSHSQLYLAFSLFVKKLLIPEVCMYCMNMYVCTKPYYRTWTYQPEKMSHTSLCVTVIHHFFSGVRRDEPGSSLFVWSQPTVRACWSCHRTTATAPTCWHSRLGDA